MSAPASATPSNSQSREPEGGDKAGRLARASSSAGPSGQRRDWAERLKPRILLIGGVLVFVGLISSAVVYRLARGGEHPGWEVAATWAGNVFASLSAAWAVAFLAVALLFSEAADRRRQRDMETAAASIVKPIQERVERAEGALERVAKRLEEVSAFLGCERPTECPSPLRRIAGFLATPPREAGSLLPPLLRARLVTLDAQTERLGHGRITFSGRTETDLLYDWLSRDVLARAQDIAIYAATIPAYLPWWLTPAGLGYLEAQRRGRPAQRVFLLSEGMADWLFGAHAASSPLLGRLLARENDATGRNGKVTLPPEWHLLRPRYVLLILILNHCVRANVRILTRACCDAHAYKKFDLALRIDTVVFQHEAEATPPKPLCSIQALAPEDDPVGWSLSISHFHARPDDIQYHLHDVQSWVALADSAGLELSKLLGEVPAFQEIAAEVATLIQGKKLLELRTELTDMAMGRQGAA